MQLEFKTWGSLVLIRTSLSDSIPEMEYLRLWVEKIGQLKAVCGQRL